MGFELSAAMLALASHTTNTHEKKQAVEEKEPVRLEPVPELSKDELNKLQAKIIKARLMGSTDLQRLEQEYDTEKRKIAYNVDVGKQVNSAYKPHKQAIRSSDTLADLVRHEKQTAHDASYDNSLAKSLLKKSRTLDDLDDSIPNAATESKKRKGQTKHKPSQEAKNATRLQTSLDRCLFCYTSERVPSISVVALGTKTYLGLPDTISLVDGHCVICPTAHVQNTLECEDDVWDEIRNFQKTLIRMFAERGQGVVFMEQSVGVHKKRHAVIECVPMPLDHFADAPMFFKEAILESAEEWSTHQKIIDTSKSMRKSMTSKLPYFHVWFDPNGGLGHVIEDEHKWVEWFGRETIAGMLDIDPSRWRRPRKVTPEEERVRLDAFKRIYDKHDWTKMLE